jgi:hypothetical protein
MNSKFHSCTDELFAQPSFLSGAARVLDLGGTFDQYNTCATPEDADLRALRGDWITVGRDMQEAIEAVTK